MALSASLIEQVYALRRAGWAYSEIARKVEISRGAVAGVLDRARKAGEVFPRRRARPRKAPVDRPKQAARAEHHHDEDALRRAAASAAETDTVAPPMPLAPAPVDPAPYEPRLIRRGREMIYEARVPLGPKSIFQLREGDCRFPFGDVRQEGVSFCGDPALDGRSWCHAHAEIVYRPKEGSRRG